MRLLLLASLIVFVLTGCSRPAQEPQTTRFMVVPVGNGAAILTDQSSGDTWRLTESGWVPIRRLSVDPMGNDPLGIRPSAPPPVSSAQIAAELGRRNAINEFLAKSADAGRIAQQLKAGAISSEQARAQLQALVPQSLGSLPPGAEAGVWHPMGK